MSRLTALRNIKNVDCFLNSVLQVLYRTPLLVEFLKSCKSPKSNAVSVISNHFSRMDRAEEGAITTSSVRRMLSQAFPVGEHHDAYETFMTVIDMIREDTRKNNVASIAPATPADARACWDAFLENEGGSHIISLFYGQSMNSIACSWCSAGRRTFETTLGVTLDAMSYPETPITLDKMLAKYTSGHVSDISLDCDRCKCSRRKAIKTTFTRLPTHLIFHINRVENMHLCQIPMIFQHNLDMGPYLADFVQATEKPTRYTLYSVLEHFGTTDNGHYTNLSAHDGAWYKFDDAEVTRLEKPPECSDSVYLLAYNRESV